VLVEALAVAVDPAVAEGNIAGLVGGQARVALASHDQPGLGLGGARAAEPGVDIVGGGEVEAHDVGSIST
jgi:hypothetical protein